MADLELIAVSASATLQEIAEQAARLGTALQNAAPADKAASPNHSIQYLHAAADILQKAAKECVKLGPAHMR